MPLLGEKAIGDCVIFFRVFRCRQAAGVSRRGQAIDVVGQAIDVVGQAIDVAPVCVTVLFSSCYGLTRFKCFVVADQALIRCPRCCAALGAVVWRFGVPSSCCSWKTPLFFACDVYMFVACDVCRASYAYRSLAFPAITLNYSISI